VVKLRVGARCEYPKFLEDVREIELAFFKVADFLKLDINEIIREVSEERNRDVITIHAPNAKVHRFREFMDVIKRCCVLANAFDCESIVLHPCFIKRKIRRDRVFYLLKSVVEPMLDEHGVYLCWETFMSKDRLFRNPHEIFEFCRNSDRFRMCYDFSHIPLSSEETLAQVREYRDVILVYHVSNREWGHAGKSGGLNHIPIFDKRGVLDFKKILNFEVLNRNASLILEYREEFHCFLKVDIDVVKKILRL